MTNASRPEVRLEQPIRRSIEGMEELLQEYYFGGKDFSQSATEQLAEEFRNEGYVKIPRFVPPTIASEVRKEVLELVEQYAVRREMYMSVTSHTPRRMKNVKSVDVARYSKFIPPLYYSKSLTSFVGRIFGQKMFTTPYENERFMILQLSEVADTHGWHWDDYAFSLVWFIESPPAECGGIVEFVPDTIWDKGNPDIVYEYLKTRVVQRREHTAGEVYLLRGDNTMHRVTPLKTPGRRTVLNLAWASADDLAKPISHETLDQLYS